MDRGADVKDTLSMIAAVFAALAAPALAQSVEKRVIGTISTAQVKGGVVSEIAWDGPATLVVQGVFGNADGSLTPMYWSSPIDKPSFASQPNHTEVSAKYWDTKAAPNSPGGKAAIAISTDNKLPMYGVGGLEQRVQGAVEMGGTQQRHVVSLGKQTLYERAGGAPPYAGEVWSWSPADLDRIAYVDKGGDLWVARADGSERVRLLKGEFTLPAWSPDGRHIAVAQMKNRGANGTWEILLVTVPANLASRS
jgi:hypothetical protein